jgi:hypothetical protein
MMSRLAAWDRVARSGIRTPAGQRDINAAPLLQTG